VSLQQPFPTDLGDAERQEVLWRIRSLSLTEIGFKCELDSLIDD